MALLLSGYSRKLSTSSCDSDNCTVSDRDDEIDPYRDLPDPPVPLALPAVALAVAAPAPDSATTTSGSDTDSDPDSDYKLLLSAYNRLHPRRRRCDFNVRKITCNM